MHYRAALIPALAAVAITGCGHKRVANRTAPPPMPVPGYSETGVASWYGPPYHGRQAADGEIYDMETLVAAHRTLPFNTWVRVVNLSNEKSVEVRIIDRGPFIDGRIIDLSKAAAREIGLLGPGVTPVRLEVVRAPEVVVPGVFAVQVGAFANRRNAERLRDSMEARYGSARIQERPGDRVLYRVLVGSEATEDNAKGLAERIRKETSEKNAGFIVRVDSVASTQ
ncbi:MAG TPA: septal ring lytic transglycosylase RlpA family protein [Bryobacteraceae bacterium]